MSVIAFHSPYQKFETNMSKGAAIFILTQNQPIRVASLKTTLYFLFRHFNAVNGGYRYPVIILHEGDLNAKDQATILAGVRRTCRDAVCFRQLDEEDFTLPGHIDPDLLKRCLAERPVPYWRTDRYRMMCRWWLVHFPRYAAEFDYVMRLDDDSFIEEPILDPIELARQGELDYLTNQLHLDCGICCFGLKAEFEKLFPGRTMELENLFTDHILELSSPLISSLERLCSISSFPMPLAFRQSRRLSMPAIFYNNFFVTRSTFWRQPEVISAINQIDRLGGIFYFRWGDAPIQTLLVRMLSPANRVRLFNFRYSKRLQREAFIDDVGGVHSFFPDTYV